MLARHGTTGERYVNRYVGSTEAPLTSEGEQQSQALAFRIEAGFWPTACWCSPLQRALQTATIVTEALGIPLTQVEELREIDFGRWEGLSFAEIARNDPALVAEWAAKPDTFRFPGGEQIESFRQRVQSVGRRLGEMEESVLVISHGGVVRTMLCHYLGLSMADYLLFDVQPARLAVVTLFDQGGVLSGFNL